MQTSEKTCVVDAENIWIIDDDQSIRFVLQRALEKAEMNITAFEFTSDLLNAISAKDVKLPDAIISDIRMPGVPSIKTATFLYERRHDRCTNPHRTVGRLPERGPDHGPLGYPARGCFGGGVQRPAGRRRQRG